MKSAVSVPDEVFAEADRLATRLGKSRSQLYTEALIEYLSQGFAAQFWWYREIASFEVGSQLWSASR